MVICHSLLSLVTFDKSFHMKDLMPEMCSGMFSCADVDRVGLFPSVTTRPTPCSDLIG